MPNRVYKVGGAATDTLADIKVLRSSASAANYDTPEDAGVNYQVPAGKTFLITRILYVSDVAVGKIVLSYGTAGVDNSASGPAGEVVLTAEIHALAANVVYPLDVAIPIPTGKFPCVRAIAQAAKLTLFGVEV